MIFAACPSSVKDEISAARVTGLLPVVARLCVVDAPGGLNERELSLRQIQEPSPGTTVKDTVDLLRKWHRWCDRMKELGGTILWGCEQTSMPRAIKILESNVTQAFTSADPRSSHRACVPRCTESADSCENEFSACLHWEVTRSYNATTSTSYCSVRGEQYRAY